MQAGAARLCPSPGFFVHHHLRPDPAPRWEPALGAPRHQRHDTVLGTERAEGWGPPDGGFVAAAPPVSARSGSGFSQASSYPNGATPGRWWVTVAASAALSQPPRFLPPQICGTTLTGARTRAAAAPRNGLRGRACRRRRTSRCDRRRPCSCQERGRTILPMQMGPQDVDPPARDDAGRGDSARSQPLSVPAPTLHALGSGAGLPRCLLSYGSELLSSRRAGLGDPPGHGQGGGSTEWAPLVLEGKEGPPPSLPRSRSIARLSQGQPCALVRPTLQLAGAFDFPLQEGRRVVSRGRSGLRTCPPFSPSPSRPVFSSAAEPSRHRLRLLSRKRSLLQRSHPGHVPYPRSWQGCYFTAILYVFLQISLCYGSRDWNTHVQGLTGILRLR